MVFLPVPGSKELKNRVHLDLHADGTAGAEDCLVDLLR